MGQVDQEEGAASKDFSLMEILRTANRKDQGKLNDSNITSLFDGNSPSTIETVSPLK